MPFHKMHGLGNDFVVIDMRQTAVSFDPAVVPQLCDRHVGIGCDQLLVLHPPTNHQADVALKIYGRSGKELSVCANGTRCVASLILREHDVRTCLIETDAGLVSARRGPDEATTIDMNEIAVDWRAIPLTRNIDTLFTPLGFDELGPPACGNIGNSHATFFVDDVETVDLSRLGPLLEHHPLFGRSTNIGVASVIGSETIRLRVWETGTGITLACGSGACAAAVASARRGLTGRRVEVMMTLGSVLVEWTDDNHVLLTGPTATSFIGYFDMSAAD